MFNEDEMDSVFHALSHSTRRQMLDYLRDRPGLAVGELAANFDVSRIAVMNHIAVLERANLITSQKQGRSRFLFLNAMPIQEIYDRWTDSYSAIWTDRMNLIKQVAEAAAHTKPETNK